MGKATWIVHTPDSEFLGSNSDGADEKGWRDTCNTSPVTLFVDGNETESQFLEIFLQPLSRQECIGVSVFTVRGL